MEPECMSSIQELVDEMDPKTAAAEIAMVMKKLFSLLVKNWEYRNPGLLF
jgi:hypothetical protein